MAPLAESLHLLLPLLASFLFVLGLLCLKRAGAAGVGPWNTTLVANCAAAVLFLGLRTLGGPGQPWYQLWQPAIIAVLYICGQVFTFMAIHHGDVSVATPLFSVKVLLVATLLTIVNNDALGTPIWGAAVLATVGIIMIQRSGGHARHARVALTVVLALAAAGSFATFDVLVQRWSPAWGAGRLLPWVFGMAAALSLVFLPVVNKHGLLTPRGRWPLLAGALLIALQALCIVFTISTFGDAARVNIVYALRGLWGVVLSWALARWFAGREADLDRSVMTQRLVGAVLVTLAVVLGIVFGGPPA